MTAAGQFVLYNLLPSLVAGVLAWLVIYTAIAVLRIEYAPLRLCLLYAPLVKSTLILLGVGLVLPWPREVFAAWHVKAFSFGVVLPYALLWAGLALLAHFVFVEHARKLALQNTEPANQVAPRLAQSIERVADAYDNCPVQVIGNKLVCCVNADLPQPELLVSRHGLTSPLVLTSGDRPTIIFPLALVSRLDDDELDRALAHEFAHFMLRSPAWCSSTTVNHITPVSPIAGLVVAQLQREEEKACDDMVITALGKPAVYADMLLKSYRFAAERSNPLASRLQVLPQLLGFKPMLTERVERLLHSDSPQHNLRLQFFTSLLLWGCVLILFFQI